MDGAYRLTVDFRGDPSLIEQLLPKLPGAADQLGVEVTFYDLSPFDDDPGPDGTRHQRGSPG